MIRALEVGVGTDIQRVADSRYLIAAQHMNDGNPGEVVRPEGVDGGRWVGSAGDVRGPEGLIIGVVELLPQEAQGLLRAEVGSDQIGVVDGEDLRAGVEVLGEAGNVGVGVRSDGGIVLIVVLERQGVFAGGVVVEVGDGLVADEVGRSGDEGVKRMRRGRE